MMNKPVKCPFCGTIIDPTGDWCYKCKWEREEYDRATRGGDDDDAPDEYKDEPSEITNFINHKL